MQSGAWRLPTPPKYRWGVCRNLRDRRANGTSLLELPLNMEDADDLMTPFDHGDGEVRVVNQEETLAVREKQKLIKERLPPGVFADPDRTERLGCVFTMTPTNTAPTPV